jgi:hypothetical protein
MKRRNRHLKGMIGTQTWANDYESAASYLSDHTRMALDSPMTALLRESILGQMTSKQEEIPR